MNKVVIGIAHPVSYTMELGNTFEYLLAIAADHFRYS